MLRVADPPLAELLARDRKVAPLLGERLAERVFRVRLCAACSNRRWSPSAIRPTIWPVTTRAGIATAAARAERRRRAVPGSRLPAGGGGGFSSGRADAGWQRVIVLPCGAGKTIVGMAVMALIQENTLILTTSQTSMEQWRRELLDKTDLPADVVAEYSSQRKNTGPVTLATYQMLTYRPSQDAEFVHFGLVSRPVLGLIIYDEVHLLPAPVFRITAELQSRRRLGLTATLIREDGLEKDVFALIGPNATTCRGANWKGKAGSPPPIVPRSHCPDAGAGYGIRAGAASQSVPHRGGESRKRAVVVDLLKQEAGHRILVIGEYIDQLQDLAADTGFPLLTGKTPQLERERLYQKGSASGRCRGWCCRGSAISRWTCRTRTCWCRCPADTVRARRKRSAWDGCCGRKGWPAGAVLYPGQSAYL